MAKGGFKSCLPLGNLVETPFPPRRSSALTWRSVGHQFWLRHDSATALEIKSPASASYLQRMYLMTHFWERPPLLEQGFMQFYVTVLQLVRMSLASGTTSLGEAQWRTWWLYTYWGGLYSWHEHAFPSMIFDHITHDLIREITVTFVKKSSSNPRPIAKQERTWNEISWHFAINSCMTSIFKLLDSSFRYYHARHNQSVITCNILIVTPWYALFVESLEIKIFVTQIDVQIKGGYSYSNVGRRHIHCSAPWKRLQNLVQAYQMAIGHPCHATSTEVTPSAQGWGGTHASACHSPNQCSLPVQMRRRSREGILAHAKAVCVTEHAWWLISQQDIADSKTGWGVR